MEQKIAVMIVHGLGRQKENYAERLIRKLSEAFAEASGLSTDQLAIEAVHWAHVFAEREEQLFRDIVSSYRLRYRWLRRIVIHYLADAVAYQPVEGDAQNYEEVHSTLSAALHRLSLAAGPTAPLCVISHSLGTVIASNFFYDLQFSSRGKRLVINPEAPIEKGETLAFFYSLGTTLPLWSLRYRDFDQPIRVPSDHLKLHHRRLEGEWINFYDKDDILGYPLQGVDPAYKETVRKDVEVNAGHWLTSWNPLSHRGYFSNPTIIRHISSTLAAAWNKVNYKR
ncbi:MULTISPECIES: chemotaxis protein [Paenibacillus]|uniref:Chemotaxis protein n=1 Tax=Paenibacillus campinasensis TaxID=66347 RepID=A0ABW9T3I3_9BACL|nr:MULTISPECIES: chemotaxis protein [Paenibacillus]MUG67679.1 chemotaxis protein [Paenibacillus campinasensis]PAK55657.1 chemotaxis protein [Paenibacillus sp. 7541]